MQSKRAQNWPERSGNEDEREKLPKLGSSQQRALHSRIRAEPSADVIERRLPSRSQYFEPRQHYTPIPITDNSPNTKLFHVDLWIVCALHHVP